MINQIDPMGADVAERIASLDPFESAGGDFERLFQISGAIERLADALLNIIPNPQMVRIISLVHIDRDEAVFCAGEFDYLISFGDVEAHRFLRNNVRARFEPGENDSGMQMVGSCNSHHVQIRNFPNDLQPRSFAEKDLWRVAGPITKVLLRSF